MKKAYKLTPIEYRINEKYIKNVEYQYGNDVSSYPKEVARKYRKAVKENKSVETPGRNSIFFTNETMYNLWLNRDTDEPITARELYSIVEGIAEAIDKAESSAKTAAAYANWDGKP